MLSAFSVAAVFFEPGPDTEFEDDPREARAVVPSKSQTQAVVKGHTSLREREEAKRRTQAAAPPNAEDSLRYFAALLSQPKTQQQPPRTPGDDGKGASSARAASGPPRLFSLGEDRVLQEYDVEASTIREGMQLKVVQPNFRSNLWI